MSAFTVLASGVLISLSITNVLPLLAAVGICTVSGHFALAVTAFCSQRGQFLAGVLLAMGCRLVPPLVACLWLAMHERSESESVFVFSLLAAYLVALATETYLSLRFVSPQSSPASAH